MTASGSPGLAIEGPVATLTLRRPDEHNRIDADDPQVVSEHLEQVAGHPEVAVLVITGTGEKTFCAGYTLTQISSRLDHRFEDMLNRLERLPIPTVCAMNGSAYGGGTDLAMSCDFRIGVRGSRLFMPAAKFGLHYYPGGLRRFVTRIGPAATKKIFLTAQSIDAEELLCIGFLTELVAREDLHSRVQAYVDSILLCERDAVKSMKRHIDELALGIGSEAAGRAAYEASLQSSATAERLAALNRAREA